LFVGALNVGSISTPWTGEIRPRSAGVAEELALPPTATRVEKGDLLGWFNMGSTVIVLLPRGAATLRDNIVAGASLRMGEPVASLHSIAP
jgi:phosphatidylserine decarboxylase